ncbi:hypothetical protein WT26_14140 [Burkholderia cepacia]|uniref:Uncharacterized protein n=2 Tax=Burkholderia cepacia complex TaxID=87882 RepID=A0A1B4PT34_BURCE|nr:MULTISPECIES: hypothetical protein [Burkholderia cepacia complex]AOK17041.1 hypothetical protein WT26_14140 [Burkholderia cepacia]AOK23777.1 hypothetical protein WK67_14075 [Burkholderia ubonensis]
MMMRNLSLLLALGVALCGCASSIKVTKLDPNAAPPKGVPWNLPMTQYTLTITRQVQSCKGTMNVKVSVAVAQGKALDPTMQYVLSSDGYWATSDITAGLGADGVSTSLNAQSTDQTAAVITGLVTSVAQIAAVAGGLDTSKPYFDCTDLVKQAHAKLNPKQLKGQPKILSLSDIVDADNKAVADATTRVTQLVTAIQTDPSQRQALRMAAEDLTNKTAKLTADQANLTTTLKVVQDVQTVVWPPRGDVFKSDHAFQMDEGTAQKWVNWFVDTPRAGTLLSGPKPTLDVSKFDVSVAIYRPDGDTGGWTSAPPPATPDIKVGVPVRVAGLGRLMVCTGTPCKKTLEPGHKLADYESLPVKPDARVLQVGQMYIVPMTGGTFKSELAAISLDTNGNPTSIEIAEKTAVAAAAVGQTASTTTQIAAIPAQVAAAKLARTQAEAAQINAETALTQAKANATTAAATATDTAQTAFATAQANLATAQANALSAGPAGQLALVTAQNNLAVAQAQAAANAQAPDEQSKIAATNQQTTLLTAQANNLNAQVALSKANAALATGP